MDKEIYDEDEAQYYEDSKQQQLDDIEFQDDFEGQPTMPLGGIYGLFEKTIERDDTTRVTNLDKAQTEIVLAQDNIAHFAETFNHKGVAKFFRGMSSIVKDTAMSKDGWLGELFVTSKKEATRTSHSNVTTKPFVPDKMGRWKIFNRKKQAPQGAPMFL